MRHRTVVSMCAAALLSAASAFSQAPPPANEVGLPQLALTGIPAKGGTKLTVTSPAFKQMADIPFENTQYQGNKFPGLEWTAGPAGTKSYAIIMQDSGMLMRGGPVLHWTLFNVIQSDSFAGDSGTPDCGDELAGVTGVWGYTATQG